MGLRRYNEEDYEGGEDAEGPLNLLLAEKALIIEASAKFKCDKGKMADALGITQRSLSDRIKAHRLRSVLV